MKIAFMGGKQAGCIGLLTVMAENHHVTGVVAYDVKMWDIAYALGFLPYGSIRDVEFQEVISECDLLVCVHGKEIVPKSFLDTKRAINVHPCLSTYKGLDPIGRMLRDKKVWASVGVHWMTENIDEGPVITERYIDITLRQSRWEVYNELYPYYSLVLVEALRKIKDDIQRS